MPLNITRSPLKSLNNNETVISPSKKRFISDETPDLPPPSAASGSNVASLRNEAALEVLGLSPIRSSVFTQSASPAPAVPEAKSRLVIEKLVLTNFKSYVGVQEIGPFHSSFSAVVGPNGSGKSNVIDSMLFVFGFRASKMRQAKLSELIHNSEKHQNLGFCSVDIYFQEVIDKEDVKDGESPVEIVEGEQVVVTRKAYRNNSSEYFINGKKSNYTVVTTLLKEKGIDLDHKRFLILQGEVESIAQMKPKAEKENDDGLLEYLEDIIGTAKYKSQIEESLEKVSELNDICAEKENRFEIVEKEKDGLESDKDKALNFLKVERNLVFKQNQLYQAEIFNKKQSSKKHFEKFDQLKVKYEAEKKQNAAMNEEILQLEHEQEKLSNKVSKLQMSLKEIQKNQRAIEREKVKLEEQKKNLSNKVGKSEKTIATSETSLGGSETKLQQLMKDQVEYEESAEKLQKELQEENGTLEQIRLELSSKTKPYSERIAKIQKELQPWEEKLSEKESQVKVAQSNVVLINKEFDKLDNEIESKQDQMEKIVDQGKNMQKQIISLKKEKAKILKQMEYGSKEIQSASGKLAQMKENLTASRHKAMEARNSLSNSQNKSKVLSGLLRLQQSGRISGFHGRLGDLGVIPDKYDVAVSTACSQLDDMVVDTVEIGQQCIEYLRSQKLGYARFICLNKLRQFNTSKISTPMNIPRLFDLITTKDPKFNNAFYSVLRDTLVADDLRAANKASYGTNKRYRVVTLDGKLIDISGTLSGGGNYVNKGGMRTVSNNSGSSDASIYSEEDVRMLEKELHAKEKHFQEAQDTLHEMEDALKALKDRGPEIEVQISKYELEMKSLTAELTTLSSSVEELTRNQDSRKKEIEQDLAKAKADVENKQTQYDNLKSEASSLRDELNSLEQKIMDIGGVKLKMQNSKVDGIKQKIEIMEERSSGTIHAIKKTQNEIKRNKKTLENSQKELKDSLAELNTIDSRIASKNEEVVKVDKECEELQREKEALAEKLEDIKESVSEKKTKVNEINSLQIELENQIEKYESLVKQDTRVLDKYKAELESLDLRDVAHLISWLDLGEPIKKAKTKSVNKKKRKRKPAKVANDDEEAGEEAEDEDDEMMDDEDSAEEDNEEGKEKEIDDEGEEDDELDANDKINKQEDSTSDDEDKAEDEYNEEELEEMKKLFHSTELPTFSEEELEEFDVEKILVEVEKLEDELANIRVDVDILEDYGRRAKEYHTRKMDLNEAVSKREELQDHVESLKKQRLSEFMKGFFTISMTLKEMYQMITMGGNAELELVDSLDPFSEGILFSVMPPKKSWRNISNLSGGEKTLSSLALVFALHKYKPTPLYVMDEIDAALDFRNVSIVANYIKERTKNAQFVVISLRNNMFELAQRLVGIYKVDNMTRSVTMKNRDLLQ